MLRRRRQRVLAIIQRVLLTSYWFFPNDCSTTTIKTIVSEVSEEVLKPTPLEVLHSFIKKEIETKFVQLVKQTLKYREENNIVRNDYLNVLKTLEDVTAHAAGFFGEGYETSSILMSFTLFELASNEHVQTKLRQEVRNIYEKNGNKLPYEELQSLSYLDAIINGTSNFCKN